MLDVSLYLLAITLIGAGLIGTVLPALPGLPMVFAGIWLAAVVDDYHHIGLWWLLLFGALTGLGVMTDLVAASLGAKRAGASKNAIWGASAGTFIGLFFGFPGLILGPFVGALLGELSSGSSALHSTHVSISTWLGQLLGAALKLVLSLVMLGLAALRWHLA